MIGSIYRTDAEPDALLWWSDRAQETAAKAAGGYGRKHRQQKTKRQRYSTHIHTPQSKIPTYKREKRKPRVLREKRDFK